MLEELGVGCQISYPQPGLSFQIIFSDTQRAKIDLLLVSIHQTSFHHIEAKMEEPLKINQIDKDFGIQIFVGMSPRAIQAIFYNGLLEKAISRRQRPTKLKIATFFSPRIVRWFGKKNPSVSNVDLILDQMGLRNSGKSIFQGQIDDLFWNEIPS